MPITTLPTEAPDAPLRRALRIDGVFSTAAGVALLASAALASPPLTTTGVLAILGAGAYTAVIGAVQYRGVRRMSAQVPA